MYELSALHEHGVFLRREALEHGYLDRDLHRAVIANQLTRIRQGAYVSSDQWARADEVSRHLLACRAVLLSHNRPVALSHTSGAALHGMRLWNVALSRVHVVRLSSRGSRKHHDIAYHDVPGHQAVLHRSGAPVLPPATCAIGAAGMSSVESGVVLLDSALQLGACTLEDLTVAYAAMRQWPGTARLQISLRLADAGSQSVGESRARVLFWNQHLPRPLLQYHVYDGSHLVGITDFAWPEYGLLGEFDGFVKYDDPRIQGDDPARVVFEEKKREDRLREVTGWRMIRLTWTDLHNGPRTGDRVRRALRPPN